jgi:hypothetical protein
MGTRTRGLANNILTGGTIDATDGLSGAIPSSNINNSSVSAVTSMPASVGDFIQSVASDPSPATVGDVWYNNATYAFKLANVTTAGTFASGGNLNTTRSGLGGAGTQTAALGFGGYLGPGPTTGVTESYNGTSWTSLPATMNTARGSGISGGTQTAAIIGQSGNAGTATELYNGTSWTNGPAMGSSIYYRSGAGTQSSTFAAGGSPNGTTSVATTETWNGSSWTVGGNLANATSQAGSVGTAADGLSIGGRQSSPVVYYNYTQRYNGTSWTSLATINTSRGLTNAFGNSSTAILCGGWASSPPTNVVSATEQWNGTSWTTSPNSLATARYAAGTSGNATLGLLFGGSTTTPPQSRTNATEEWTGPGVATTQTITTS